MNGPPEKGDRCPMSWASVEPGEPWDDLWPFLDGVREEGIVWDDELNAWLAGSYLACRALALGDGDGWQKLILPAMAEDVELELVGWGSPRTITYVRRGTKRNSQEHGRFHRWWLRAFSPRVIAGWREQRIRPIVHERIDRFARHGSAELYEELARPVPTSIIAATLGLPADDEFVGKCADYRDKARIARTGPTPVRELPTDHPLVQDALTAAREWTELLRPPVRAARGTSGDDFLSMLWRDADTFFDPGWDEDDILGTVKLMFGAGSYTASAGIANALYLLATHPDLQSVIREGGEKTMTNFVEEALRLYPPAILTGRLATDELELAGATISPGQSGIMLNAAANRDPQKFDRPLEIDLDRPSPRAHLAFHFGPRACPGQALARAEIMETVSATLARLPQLRLDPAGSAPSYPGDPRSLVRGWTPLHVLFTPER